MTRAQALGWGRFLVLFLCSCKSLGKLLNFFRLWFSCLWNGTNHNYLLGLLWELNETLCRKDLAQSFTVQGFKKNLVPLALCFSFLSQSLFWNDQPCLCFRLCTKYANILLLARMILPLSLWLSLWFYRNFAQGGKNSQSYLETIYMTPWLNFIVFFFFSLWVLCVGPFYPLGTVGRMPGVYENVGALNKKFWLWNTKHKNCKTEINKRLDKWVGNNTVSTSLIVTFRCHNYFITFENNL